MTNDFERELFDDAKARHDKAVKEFKEDETYIKLEYAKHIVPENWEDESFEPTTPPTAYEAVENAVNHILTTPITFVPVRPVTKNVEQQRQIAEARRQFHDMWWNRVFEDQGDPLRRVTKSLVKGKGVLKLEVRWDLIPDPDKISKQKFRSMVEKVGRYKFLWNLRVVPKETVFEIGDPWHPSEVYEAYDITVEEALRRWPDNEEMAKQLKDMKPLETVRYIEYWSQPKADDPGKFMQWVNDYKVHEADNPYSWESPIHTEENPDYDGFIPYVIGDPGWGDTDASSKPEDRYVSIIRPIRSVAVAEARYLTELDMWLRWYVFPAIKAINMDAPKDDEDPIRLGPGEVWYLDQKTPETAQDIAVMPLGEAPATLLQGLARVNQYIDLASKFSVLGGVAQRGVDTATEADMNVRNAQSKLTGLINSLRRMCIVINRMVAQTIEHVIGVPITLYGATEGGPSEVTIKPSDIKGFYHTQVELSTSDEAALNLRNARTWADLTQVIPVSFRTAMEKAGIRNPSAEMDERMLEDLEKSPQAMQALLLAMISAQQDVASKMVRQGMESQITTGNFGEGQQRSAALPANPSNPVEALRQETRNEAIQNQPERQMF